MLIQGQLKSVRFEAGDFLFKEGEQSYHFFIIQDGEVEIFRSSDNGKMVLLAVVGEGSSIGEFAMIDRMPRSATARAKTAVTAVEVSEGAYEELLSDLPDWAVAVMRALVSRLRNANEIIRKSKMVDPQIQNQIDSTEYDPESSKIKKLAPENDDLPDLG